MMLTLFMSDREKKKTEAVGKQYDVLILTSCPCLNAWELNINFSLPLCMYVFTQ